MAEKVEITISVDKEPYEKLVKLCEILDTDLQAWMEAKFNDELKNQLLFMAEYWDGKNEIGP
jgi:hypothetical protein